MGRGFIIGTPKTNAAGQLNITAGFPSGVLYRIEPDAFENLRISSDYFQESILLAMNCCTSWASGNPERALFRYSNMLYSRREPDLHRTSSTVCPGVVGDSRDHFGFGPDGQAVGRWFYSQ